jgi:membrane protein insertase Oxa1/YidC/SpoIIIJ
LAGAVQFAHLSLTLGKIDLSKDGSKFGALGADFGKTLQVQMKYILPIVIAVIAYISSVLALYLISASLFALIQDFVIKKGVAKETEKRNAENV